MLPFSFLLYKTSEKRIHKQWKTITCNVSQYIFTLRFPATTEKKIKFRVNSSFFLVENRVFFKKMYFDWLCVANFKRCLAFVDCVLWVAVVKIFARIECIRSTIVCYLYRIRHSRIPYKFAIYELLLQFLHVCARMCHFSSSTK